VRALVLLMAVGAFAAGCGGEGGGIARPDEPLWCPTDRGPTGEPLRGSQRGTFDARLVLGRQEDQGRSLARGAGCEVRVARRDGEELPGILDLDPRRINVAVEDDTIVEVLDIG
jgi:hypothetical protein